MKIGIVADSHGNATALKAVIQDAKEKGVAEFISAGDLTMKGPSPQECIDLLEDENCVAFVQGNHEILYQKYLAGTKFGLDEDREEMCQKLNEFDWKHLTHQTYEKLAGLPVNKELERFQMRIHVIHDYNFYPKYCQMFRQAELIICAHTHQQSLSVNPFDAIVINPGTVGLPSNKNRKLQDSKAQYGILEIDKSGILDIRFERVSYDIEKELQIARKRGLPYLELYEKTLRGGNYGYDLSAIHQLNQKIKKWVMQ